MRNATAYGASPRLRLDIVLNDLVASAYTTGRIYIKSDGTPWRPIVHIRDIIAAVIAVLDAPREAVHNQTFNVGRNDENFRIRELAEIVAEVVPGCRVEYAPGGGPDLRCYRVNFDKIDRLVPAFRPQWTARKGAQELYDAYRTIGLTLRISSVDAMSGSAKFNVCRERAARWRPALDSRAAETTVGSLMMENCSRR